MPSPPPLRVRPLAIHDLLIHSLETGVDRVSVYDLAASLQITPRDVSASLAVLAFSNIVEIKCESDEDRRRSIFRFKLPKG